MLVIVFPSCVSGGVARRSKGSTSSADRQMGTVKEDVREESAESQRYVNFDPIGLCSIISVQSATAKPEH